VKDLVAAPAGESVRRQAIAVFSDGEDTASLVSFDDVLQLARRASIAMYTVTMQPIHAAALDARDPRIARTRFCMKALAEETGGRAYFPTVADELSGVFGSIAREIAAQYALGYISTNSTQDRSYRRINVRVLNYPGGSRARTRLGYYADIQ
jgi:VWFA-related protein